ncbi:phosphate ABC transporter ATP-binding protein [Desulfofundulus thermobenzoicus]|uniref:Phosphate ABC transporter ATP-binding protein n=1 Tax=Desulfofundulus thermobenzoicus TaxID=29376 RepID=A0A6N7INQ8_9FIRM|nr:phosphate ABC transporter ATP-binding protein PstB [Desulfofundulus thermobenzoicus]MQL51656.1 phosphate ABC transporter ATP-binding protein [Desulfofundulus thermobenzoicus]HHW43710.1 phosphate ABC transporter ATP-binding protein [Desulfotomaculum sp.]
MSFKLQVEELQAWYDDQQVLKGINLSVRANSITAVIGPSGCGKSTFIRCLNRMHEVVPGARVAGRVCIDEVNIYNGISPVEVRRRVGMVFQSPNIFPNMSILHNVVAGLSLNGVRNKKLLEEKAEYCLKQVGLWEEVKDRLHGAAGGLSSGQLQRVCIARALAVEPEVLLMDEPCSALDPIASIRIEELMRELKEKYTIVLVTHNMQQAARVSDYTAFLCQGELIEYGSTPEVFIRPRDRRTENYITGRGDSVAV